MGNYQHRAVIVKQGVFKLLAGECVKVVRRLVQKQKIVTAEHKIEKCDPCSFSAAQLGNLFENIVPLEKERRQCTANLSLRHFRIM